jgi:hypothetical protein
VRGLLWITAIALAGLGLLFLAWRLLPPEARATAQPSIEAQAEPQPLDRPPLATPSPSPEAPARSAPAQPPEPEAPPVVEAPPADGLEEGGLAQAARPLPDFSAKYAGTLRSDLLLAARSLEEKIQAERATLPPADLAELDARLANQPREGELTPGLAYLLALHDELAWLRQQLALPVIDDR